MTKTLAEARAFVDELVAHPVPAGLQPFVLPAHTTLAAVRDRLPDGYPLLLGAQNAHWASEGVGTGEVSMRMVADAGATLVEVGHSERREQFGETDQMVAVKAAAALAAGLTPLICVGESTAVREAGRAEDHVEAQVRAALTSVSPGDISRLLLAYEPVWAIGERGQPAAPEQVAPVFARIAAVVAELSTSQPVRGLLYGGGVSRDNAAALLREPDVDGLFVGRAGWSASSFLALLELASASRATPAGP